MRFSILSLLKKAEGEPAGKPTGMRSIINAINQEAAQAGRLGGADYGQMAQHHPGGIETLARKGVNVEPPKTVGGDPVHYGRPRHLGPAPSTGPERVPVRPAPASPTPPPLPSSAPGSAPGLGSAPLGNFELPLSSSALSSSQLPAAMKPLTSPSPPTPAAMKPTTPPPRRGSPLRKGLGLTGLVGGATGLGALGYKLLGGGSDKGNAAGVAQDAAQGGVPPEQIKDAQALAAVAPTLCGVLARCFDRGLDDRAVDTVVKVAARQTPHIARELEMLTGYG